jgi:peptidoglycan/LPS O-acetylase OafA/YrhL
MPKACFPTCFPDKSMNSTIAQPDARSSFVREFEGLRGLLAAWVILGHILLVSGFTYQDGLFGIIFSPVLGVYAFMILSGFVITAALDLRPTSWRSFMKRRFFRLFPVYVLCLTFAVVMLGASMQISRSPAMSVFGPENVERLSNVQENFWLYLFADATLLQCLLPRIWYPAAHESFLVPTWSLTIEWLFYMVAPFIVLLIRRSKWTAIVGAIAVLGLIGLLESQLTWINQSFHLGNAFHFLTGIGSFYLWKQLPTCRNSWLAKTAFWFLLLGAMAMTGLPYKIWFAVMAMVLYPRFHSQKLFFLEWLRQVILSKPLLNLGERSYAAYLIHWIIIEIVLFWTMHFAPGLTEKYMLTTLCICLVYPLTWLASDYIHRYVEKPMIELPKRWKSRLEPSLAAPV